MPPAWYTSANLAGLALTALGCAIANVAAGLVLGHGDAHYPAAVVCAVAGFFAALLAKAASNDGL
jgi:tellurite resistance protein TehA-like permease